jgi:hypothetical protein
MGVALRMIATKFFAFFVLQQSEGATIGRKVRGRSFNW